MSNKHPSIRQNGHTYFADSCRPLKDAAKKRLVRMEAWGRYNYPGSKRLDKQLPGLSSVGYWDAAVRQQWGLDWHRNEGIEISFVENGKVPFSVDQSVHLVPTGHLTITRPWQLHRVGDPLVSAGKFFWLIIDVGVRHPHQEWSWPDWVILSKHDLEELTKMLRQNEQPVWCANTEIKNCFQKISAALKCQEESHESWMVLCINEVLLHLLRLFRSGQIDLSESLVESKRTVELFINELDALLMEPWTLEAMANHCKLKPTRFSHYFKQITNQSPMHYLTEARLNAATQLLLQRPTVDIKGICYQCGFSSGEYFSTLFRKKFGCTPSNYRVRSAG